MDTEIRPREPNEKQKAAAYDQFFKWLMADGNPNLSERYWMQLLRNFAMEAPDGSEEG